MRIKYFTMLQNAYFSIFETLQSMHFPPRHLQPKNVICVHGDFRLQGRESYSFFFTIRDRLNVLLEVSEPKFSVYLLKY